MKQRRPADDLITRSFKHLLRCAFLMGVLLGTFSRYPQLNLSESSLHLSSRAWAAPKKNKAKDIAKTAFKRGRVAFNDKRYIEALLSFEEAYQSYPLPLMLYNIANVYERLNLLPQALNQYRSFIATGKDKTGEAADKVKRLEEKLKDWVLVLISSEPTGAEVRLVDQRLPALGKTPVSLRLPPQRVLNVILTPQRGEVISKEITLKTTPPNQSLNLKIPQKEAWVRVIGSPRQAKVRSGEIKKSGLRGRGVCSVKLSVTE